MLGVGQLLIPCSCAANCRAAAAAVDEDDDVVVAAAAGRDCFLGNVGWLDETR
jgi:hypothetical protein